MESRTKKSFRNTYSGLISRCVNLLVPFFIRTVIIHKLGSEYLGLSSLFTSVIHVLNLAELGIGNALVFSMYKPVAEDDRPRICALLALYKKVYRIIGCIVLAAGLGVMPFLPALTDMKALEGTDINLYLIFLIYLSNTVCTYLFFAYKRSVLIANQRQDVVNTVDSAVHLTMYAVQIVLLYLVPDYYIYILMLPLFTLIDNGAAAYFAHRLFPYIREKSDVKAEIGPILQNTKYLIGHKIGAVIISSADSIVISAFLSMNTLTSYSNYFYVISALNGFINVGYNAILAGVGNSIIKDSKEKLCSLFRELSFILFYIVSVCTVCLLALIQPFMMLWMGEGLMFTADTAVLFALYFYTWQVRVMGLNFKDAAGMWKNDALKPYVGMVVNIVMDLVLVNTVGVNGVLSATVAVMVFVYFPWETKVLFRDLFERSPKAYVLSELGYAAATALTAAAAYYTVSLIPLGGVPGLMLKGFISLAVGNICLLVMYSRSPELRLAAARIKRMIKK